jgi:hypothetical protein
LSEPASRNRSSPVFDDKQHFDPMACQAVEGDVISFRVHAPKPGAPDIGQLGAELEA